MSLSNARFLARYVHEHPLTTQQHYPFRACSFCHEPSPQEAVTVCESCTFCICMRCIPGKVSHPLHPHPMALLDVADYTKEAIQDCSLCGNAITEGKASICSECCPFYLCASCHFEKPLVELQTALRAVSKHKHLLVHTRWCSERYGHGFLCNMCFRGNSPTRWTCEACEYDLCETCCDGNMTSTVPANTDTGGDQTLCGVCHDQPRDTCFIHNNHTAHLFSCYGCAVKIHQRKSGCPVCRGEIEAVVRVYG